MKITTNNHTRPLLPLCDLPLSAQSDFDYIDDAYTNRLVQYKGAWYDVHDTQRIDVTSVTANASPIGWAMVVNPYDPMARYHAIVSESYFSGVLFKLTPEDGVICARYYS